MLLNGELLRVAEEAGFDVLLTTDQNLAHQQKRRGDLQDFESFPGTMHPTTIS
jgi:hypothetical protein